MGIVMGKGAKRENGVSWSDPISGKIEPIHQLIKFHFTKFNTSQDTMKYIFSKKKKDQ